MENEEQLVIERQLRRELKKLNRRKNQLLIQKENGEKWPSVEHEGHLLQAHFQCLKKGQQRVELRDWELNDQSRALELDPAKSPQENVSARYRLAKKLKGALEHAGRRLEETEREIHIQEERLAALEAVKTEEELESWKEAVQWAPARPKSQVKQPEKKATGYREYHTASGLSIYVGKSAQDNDRLTFQFARGSDWWLHVTDYPGSHVVLRPKRKDEEPDQESIADALQVALHYSKAKQAGSGEVCLTQQKFVARISKKLPGKVRLSSHKTIHVRMDPDRFETLKRRGQSF